MGHEESGLAWVGGDKGSFRYFTSHREIKKGKHKGEVEVVTPDGKKHTVEVESIRRYPSDG